MNSKIGTTATKFGIPGTRNNPGGEKKKDPGIVSPSYTLLLTHGFETSRVRSAKFRTFYVTHNPHNINLQIQAYEKVCLIRVLHTCTYINVRTNPISESVHWTDTSLVCRLERKKEIYS